MTQPRHTRGILQAARRQWIANWRVALALGVGVILSIASGYTTWDGMVAFTAPNENDRSLLAILLATFVTGGIQIAMLLSAWKVGAALLQIAAPYRTLGFRLYVFGGASVWLVIFAATLAASVLFSYHSFYNAITGYFPNIVAGDATSKIQDEANQRARGNRSPHMNNLAEIYVRSTVEDSLGKMREVAEAQRQDYFEVLTRPVDQLSPDARALLTANSSLVTVGDAWNSYLEQMRGIVGAARKYIPDIKRLANAQAEEDRERVNDLAAERAILESDLERGNNRQSRAKDAIKDLEQRIGKLDDTIKDLEGKRGAFKKQERDAKLRMDCELRGVQCQGSPPTKPGRGPRYLSAKANRDAALLESRSVAGELTEKQNRREELEIRRDDLATVITSTEEKIKKIEAHLNAVPMVTVKSALTALEFQGVVDAMDRALSRLNGPEEFGEDKISLDVRISDQTDASSKTIDDALDQVLPGLDRPEIFGEINEPPVAQKGAETLSPGPAKIGPGSVRRPALVEVASACDLIRVQLSNVSYGVIAAEAQKWDCAQKDLDKAIGRIRDLNSGLREFVEASCHHLGEDFRDANTTQLIRRGEECLDIIGIHGTRAAEFASELAKLDREHNEIVHPFVQSLAGIRVYDDYLAYLSLAIALMIDLLVFFTGIVGGNENLRSIDRIGQEVSGAEALELALSASKDRRPSDCERVTLARLVLNRLVPKEFVEHPEKAPHIVYSGYIPDNELELGDPEDDMIRRQIQIWMSTPKTKVELVLRSPRNDPPANVQDTGLRGSVTTPEADPVRFFFLRELIIDLAQDIVHWDKAHASTSDGSDSTATATKQYRSRRTRQREEKTTGRRFRLVWRSSKTYQGDKDTTTGTDGDRSGTERMSVVQPPDETRKHWARQAERVPTPDDRSNDIKQL